MDRDEIEELLSYCMEKNEIQILSQRWMKRQAKAQFLVEMDRLSSKSGDFGVFVIGATDRPQEMDEDASGRFAKQIFVEMPDKKAREKMLWKIVKKNENDFELSGKEIDQLALMTENFSFDDSLELCQTANLAIVHNASEQNEFFQGTMDAQLRRIKMKDLENAIETVQHRPKKAKNKQKLGELQKQKSKAKQSNGKGKEPKIEDLENAIEKTNTKASKTENKLKKQKSKGNKRNGNEKVLSITMADFQTFLANGLVAATMPLFFASQTYGKNLKVAKSKELFWVIVLIQHVAG
ncbi:hypothetical protein niasHT_017951 [Heterodera trifolii]|uniref:ATPase AAA-type core domain-containing protein n=1 Tax=Heterodera trifolii TaxID=157864 RepID=A0ABD2LJN8_9BILA